MSALISDVITGVISPGICNAAVNAGGKMLKAAEMQIKYGTAQPNRVLTLTGRDREPAAEPPRALPAKRRRAA
jgi:hypothetical protein